MRKTMLSLGLAAAAAPVAMATPVQAAPHAPMFSAATAALFDAPSFEEQRRYRYREWRGRDGRYYCRKRDGTTGLIVGGVAGALVGRTIDTRGDRTVGTLLGAAAGAVAGREIERSGSKRRCR